MKVLSLQDLDAETQMAGMDHTAMCQRSGAWSCVPFPIAVSKCSILSLALTSNPIPDYPHFPDGFSPTSACRPEYFRCNSGECIPFKYTCDTIRHCKDNSDETVPCSKHHILCHSQMIYTAITGVFTPLSIFRE